MPKALRMLGAVALATAAVPLIGVSPAYAEASVIVPGSQGYFNAAGIDKPDQSPQAPPNPINSVDGVDKDHLAVAARNGQEDKVSALLFDLSTLGTGSIVTKAELTLPLATGNTNLQAQASPTKVQACGAGDTGFGGEDGSAIALAPERLCKVFSAVAKASADGKAYVIDITGIAATWVDGANDGLTLTSVEAARTAPFQVVFQPGPKISLAVQYTPGAPLPGDMPPPPADTSFDTDTTTPPDLGGFSGGTGVSEPVDAGFGAVAAPPAAEPGPMPGIAPQPDTTPTSGTAAPVDLEMLRPTTAFWVAGLVLAGVLALLSLIMGDSPTAASAAKRQSRLSSALAARQRVTSGSRSGLGRPAAI